MVWFTNDIDKMNAAARACIVGRKANNECNIAHVYCETSDGTVYEVKGRECIGGDRAIFFINLDANGEVIPPCDEMSSVIATEITFLHFDSVKALKELLESNRYDFLETLIDKSHFVFTSLKTIERRAEWFDVSRLFGYSDVDGDPSTLVTAMLKESLKDKKSKIPEELVSLINNIFKGFTSTSETLSDDEQTKVQILKLIGFFVELADLLQE